MTEEKDGEKKGPDWMVKHWNDASGLADEKSWVGEGTREHPQMDGTYSGKEIGDIMTLVRAYYHNHPQQMSIVFQGLIMAGASMAYNVQMSKADFVDIAAATFDDFNVAMSQEKGEDA